MLIEFIEQALKKGMDVKEVVIESGRVRLRPIILTAIKSIVALIPVAISGDALFPPLAVTIISGILFSTVLTLIIVPMLYVIQLSALNLIKALTLHSASPSYNGIKTYCALYAS